MSSIKKTSDTDQLDFIFVGESTLTEFAPVCCNCSDDYKN
jgi:hypothetical protein